MNTVKIIPLARIINIERYINGFVIHFNRKKYTIVRMNEKAVTIKINGQVIVISTIYLEKEDPNN